MDSQESSVLDELAAGSSQVPSAGKVSSSNLCMFNLLNMCIIEILTNTRHPDFSSSLLCKCFNASL